MATPQKHKVLVRAAYHLLQSPVARGTLYTMEAFADIMNKCIGASSNKYEIRVDGDLMTRAFTIKGKKKDGDFIPFTDHDITSCGEDGVFVLSSHQGGRGGTRTAYIGRFSTLKNAQEAFKSGAIEAKGEDAKTRVLTNKWNRLPQQMLVHFDSYLNKHVGTLENAIKRERTNKSDAAKVREAKKREREAEEANEAKRQKNHIEVLLSQYMDCKNKASVANTKREQLLDDLKQDRKKMAEIQAELIALSPNAPGLGMFSTQPDPMEGYSNNPEEETPVDLSDFLYIYNGRAGSISLHHDQKLILIEDMLNNLEELPDGIDNDEAEETRVKREYSVDNFGATQFWIPAGCTSTPANKMSSKDQAYKIVTNIKKKFGGDSCTFSHESLTYLAAFMVTAYGASDEAIEMIIAGWTKALFHEVGLDELITADMISKGIPSKTTLRRLEFRLAADCIVSRIQEMVDDDATSFALITDHGKRAGMEHFVKLLCWFGKDKEGREIIKFHCIDVDTSNHSGEDCAAAIKKSVEVFTGRENVEVVAITGDAGGGASVQSLLPHLKRLCAVSKDCSKINCNLHALNKCLESSFQDVLGKQGIGQKTPFQLLFVFNQLWKRIREEYGGDFLNEIWQITFNELINNDRWKDEAEKNFPQSYSTLLKKLDILENQEDDAGIDELVELMTARPTDLQDPVFSRWMTVLMSCKVVTEHWSVIYFIAVAVKQDAAPNSYLWQLSCALLSLMNTRAVPDNESPNDNDGQTFDQFINSFNDQNTAEDYYVPKPGETPTFYAMLLWMQGFAEAYFDDTFDWMMRYDPELGDGSWGQTTRLAVERCYVMHKMLRDLENDGWKQREEFKPYLDSLKGIPEKDDVSKVGKEYFEKMPGKVLEKFRFVFEKHVVSCWCSDDILHYIIGGNPTLANEFAAWMVNYELTIPDEDLLAAAAVAGHGDDDEPLVEAHRFADEEITLKHHQGRAKKDVKVNVYECMTYLTAEADREHIMARPFVKKHWQHIKQMGTVEETIDLFDKDTWGDYDYEPLRQAVLREISIHPVHQQRCENYVQLAALISKTRVNEARRTARSIIISTCQRVWSKEALEKVIKKIRKQNEKKPKEKRRDIKKVRRAEGSARVKHYIKAVDDFIKNVKRATNLLGKPKWDEIHKQVASKQSKMSAIDAKKRKEKFEQNIKKSRTFVKAELPRGVDVTAAMDGGVLLRLLTNKNSCNACCKDPSQECSAVHCAMSAVHAEIAERKIKMRKGWKKSLNIKEKRHALRDNELQISVLDGDKIKGQIDKTHIRHIKPQSNKMEAMIQRQTAILDKELSLDAATT